MVVINCGLQKRREGRFVNMTKMNVNLSFILLKYERQKFKCAWKCKNEKFQTSIKI